MKRLLYVLIYVIFVTVPSHAAFSPISVSIIPPLQFPPQNFTVTGARVSAIYGRQRDIYGLDVGVIGNITDQTFTGIGVSGIFNWTKGQTTAIGLQAAGVANINTNKTNVVGAQVAAVVNSNSQASSVSGLQFALANLSTFTTINGLQVGVYNEAQTVNGFQIGLINKTENLRGFQIGLLNYYSKGLFSISPILNFGF